MTRELGLFALFGLLIGGIDDLAVDLLWLGRGLRRRLFIFTRHPRATMNSLSPPRHPGRIVVMIGAWDESNVIRRMLSEAVARIRHDNYRIYVGAYPNDPDTVREVLAVGDDRIRLVRGGRNGPTTKAECLNRVWRAVIADERASGIPVKAVVLHDAEDIVHPLELDLYDRMIERFDLVQIPVVPLVSERGWFARTISLTYGDEFAEAHTKQLAVREAIGAAVPSAGVGCAISRTMMERIATSRDGLPFDEGSLTEDYELGLTVRALGGRGVLVSIPAGPGKPLVAVRAHFPDTLDTAVRQKSRWIIGIALAGWDRMRWEGGLAERWMRLRDRRAPIAAILIVAAYASFALSLACWSIGVDPGWPERTGRLFSLTGFLLLWRFTIRAVIVGRCYGWWQGLLSIPRVLVGNLIDVAAARRALSIYVPDQIPRWDKTGHHFPTELPCD